MTRLRQGYGGQAKRETPKNEGTTKQTADRQDSMLVFRHSDFLRGFPLQADQPPAGGIWVFRVSRETLFSSGAGGPTILAVG